jgi:hypothetical protein
VVGSFAPLQFELFNFSLINEIGKAFAFKKKEVNKGQDGLESKRTT